MQFFFSESKKNKVKFLLILLKSVFYSRIKLLLNKKSKFFKMKVKDEINSEAIFY